MFLVFINILGLLKLFFFVVKKLMFILYFYNKINKEVKIDIFNYRGDYLVMIGEWDDGGIYI